MKRKLKTNRRQAAGGDRRGEGTESEACNSKKRRPKQGENAKTEARRNPLDAGRGCPT